MQLHISGELIFVEYQKCWIKARPTDAEDSLTHFLVDILGLQC